MTGETEPIKIPLRYLTERANGDQQILGFDYAGHHLRADPPIHVRRGDVVSLLEGGTVEVKRGGVTIHTQTLKA